jgi:cytochrome c-type biogenesis protein CcmH
MLFWIIIAGMTGAAMLAVLRPLARAATAAAPAAHDAAVYRDQLAELARDLARGAIAPAEAEAARREIARRLLAAEAARGAIAPSGDARRRKLATLVGLVGVPALALPLYGAMGAPFLPAAPLAPRLERVEREALRLAERLEAHLSTNPGDRRGWEVLAAVYGRLGRGPEATRAAGELVRLARAAVTADAADASGWVSLVRAEAMRGGEAGARAALAEARAALAGRAEGLARLDALAAEIGGTAP